jgi:hypothetical protein
MRGSVAENRGRNSGYHRHSNRGNREGYTMRPSSARDGYQSQTVQVRLGKLQVAVWIGLALAATSGAYLVGFYSGRHVGFQVARDTSAIDLAKLSVSHVSFVDVEKNSAKIYEKLNRPAVIEESREANKLEAKSAVAVKTASGLDGSSPNDLGDDLFRDLTSGGELIIGDEASIQKVLKEKPASDKKQLDLKGEKTQVAVERTKQAPKATSDDSKFAQTIPTGFYAQVAAPKRLADAEKLARRLKQSGFPIAIESVLIGQQSFYRVLVGPEKNKLYAERLISQLQSERYIPTDPFIREVS